MILKHASFFTGIGGFDLAAQRVGWENVFQCEIDGFCQQVLKYYWPNAKLYEDIKKSDFTIHRGRINVLSGGFPCQPFSQAGNRGGTDDDRYLWPEMLRGIDEIQPPWVVAENVTGIINMEDKSGIYRDVFPKMEDRKIIRYDTVDLYEAVYTRQAKMLIESICQDLEKIGFEVYPVVIPAASVQAPHQRDRVWIIAYSADNGSRNRRRHGNDQKREANPEIRNEGIKEHEYREDGSVGATSNTEGNGWRKRVGQEVNGKGWKITKSGQKRGGVWDDSGTEDNIARDVVNTERKRGREIHQDIQPEKPERKIAHSFDEPNNWEKWPTQSPICFGNDGLSDRLAGITFSKFRGQALKGLGNAIVPQVVLEIFKYIDEIEENIAHEQNS